jgi:hypothetical protein
MPQALTYWLMMVSAPGAGTHDYDLRKLLLLLLLDSSLSGSSLSLSSNKSGLVNCGGASDCDFKI